MKLIIFNVKEYEVKYFENIKKDYKNLKIEYVKEKLNVQNINKIKGYDGVCTIAGNEITEEILEKIKENKIKILLNRCAGFDNINYKSAEKLGIEVLRVPSYSPESIAEFTLMLTLMSLRKMKKTFRNIEQRNFQNNELIGTTLQGKVVGIIGLGKIGKLFAKMVTSLGGRVIAYTRTPDKNFAKQNKVQFKSLDELYKLSDIISLHVPLTDKTKYLINTNSLNKMKHDVILINTSRGKLINTSALLDAIDTNIVGSCSLDVYENEDKYFFKNKKNEKIKDENLLKLIKYDNVILTSHQAYLTKESLEEIAKVTLENFSGYLNNEDKSYFSIIQ